MQLFETAFRKDYNYYERYYCADTKKSIVRKITQPSEWFVEDTRGQYESIIDANIKLRKEEGSQKNGREHWGLTDPIYRTIREKYWHEHQQNTYNKNPKIMYLDIETRVGTSGTKGFPHPDKALEPVSLIQIFDSETKTMFVLGVKDFKYKNKYSYEFEVKYVKAKDEVHMLELFGKIFNKINPLLIYAWNGNNFDYPYLYNRIKKLGLNPDKILSANGSVTLKEKKLGYRTTYSLSSNGHIFMDLLEIYKKFVFGEESSYKLDYIAKKLLGKQKVEHTEYTNFDDFYTGNYNIPENPTEEQKNSEIYQAAIRGDKELVQDLSYSEFVNYGIIDTYLIKEIDDYKNFTLLVITLAEKMGVLIEDTLGTVKPWTHFIANKARLKNKIIPKVHKVEENDSIKGGYVREPEIGKHQWIMSGDYNSMYPLIGMVSMNASPETYVPINKLPSDLRQIVIKYYNNEDDEERLKLTPEFKQKVLKLLKKYNYALSITGAVYTKDKIGLIPEIVIDIYTERKQVKKQMFKYDQKAEDIKSYLKTKDIEIQNIDINHNLKDPLEYSDFDKLEINDLISLYHLAIQQKSILNTVQLSLKLAINSLYGALTNAYFPLFNLEIARSITGNGRYLIQKTAEAVQNKLESMIPGHQYVIAGDTDSNYFQIDPFVKRAFANKPDATIDDKINFCDNFYETIIDKVTQEAINTFAEEQNIFDSSVIGCEREIIADKAVFTAKKKYFARVLNSEGVRYKPYKLKIMGLDIIRSGTPEFVKRKLKESINIILDSTEDEMILWKNKIREEFIKAPLDDIAKMQGVSNVNYTLGEKSIPIGARSAIVHNEFVKKNNLENIFDFIVADDKVKQLYLREPNIFNSNIIAWKDDKFIKYIQESNCVDYDTCFEKYFISPLEIMTSALKWNIKRETESLDDW